MDLVASELEHLLGVYVENIDEILGENVGYAVENMKKGEIVLLENLSFTSHENENDEIFAQSLAEIADVYVNDYFRDAHLKKASNVGITKYLPSYAGLLLEKEVKQLQELKNTLPINPFVLILGGNNPESTIPLIEEFITTVNYVLVAGYTGLAFLKAQGYEIGKIKISDNAVNMAKEILIQANENGVTIKTPDDVLVASEIKSGADHKFVSSQNIPKDMYVVDIGPHTFNEFNKLIYDANLVIWDGVVGVYEIPEFEYGTRSLAQAVASTEAKTVAGGIKTYEAVNKYGKLKYIDCVSTGGDSFIEFLEGVELPAIKALEN